ncbi:MAG: hypothetical protein ACLGI3_05045, partial [Actinomycetes bacterium]
RARGQSTDTLPCITYYRALQRRAAAWQPGDVVEVEGALQRRAALWQPGDVIEVEGALQRRFWRTATGTASVCEVNCRRGRKVPRSGAWTRERTA